MDIEYVLTHAADAADRLQRLETDLRLANDRIMELTAALQVALSPKKRWWQK